MTSLSLYILLAATFLLTSLIPSNATEDERNCRQVLLGLGKRFLKYLSKCLKKLGLTTGQEKAIKLLCIVKCGAEMEGLINEKGEVSRKYIDTFVENDIPPTMREKVLEVFLPCIDKYEGTLDPNTETDPNCITYEPPVRCMMHALPKFCPEAKKFVSMAEEQMAKAKENAKIAS